MAWLYAFQSNILCMHDNRISLCVQNTKISNKEQLGRLYEGLHKSIKEHGKNGHRYKRNAYGMKEKNGKCLSQDD